MSDFDYGKIHVVIDMYGTAIDTSSLGANLVGQGFAGGNPDKCEELAKLWQQKQDEWKQWSNNNTTGTRLSAKEMLLRSFRDAADLLGVDLNGEFKDDEKLMTDIEESYINLKDFPGVSKALNKIDHESGIMYTLATDSSECLVTATLSKYLLKNIPIASTSFEDSGIEYYRPHRELYDECVRGVDMQDHPQDVYWVSANPNDIVGARAAGLTAVYIDREDKGWTNVVGSHYTPSFTTKDIEEAVDKIINIKRTA
ncbi:HAD-like domain-containing protein [Camillea tinctor]|nr:HAD-like domain-containing protein [Camillea tinctor]